MLAVVVVGRAEDLDVGISHLNADIDALAKVELQNVDRRLGGHRVAVEGHHLEAVTGQRREMPMLRWH